MCQPQITFQKASDIVEHFIGQGKTNIELLRQHFQQHVVTDRYLYANLYPKLVQLRQVSQKKIEITAKIQMDARIARKQEKEGKKRKY